MSKEGEALHTDAFRDRVRSGDRTAIAKAIAYLEADPSHFRSGYVKADLAAWLTHPDLTSGDVSRLLDVCWRVACDRRRREFRHYCILAARISAPDFLARVNDRAQSDDPYGNFSYLRSYLDGSIGFADGST